MKSVLRVMIITTINHTFPIWCFVVIVEARLEATCILI